MTVNDVTQETEEERKESSDEEAAVVALRKNNYNQRHDEITSLIRSELLADDEFISLLREKIFCGVEDHQSITIIRSSSNLDVLAASGRSSAASTNKKLLSSNESESCSCGFIGDEEEQMLGSIKINRSSSLANTTVNMYSSQKEESEDDDDDIETSSPPNNNDAKNIQLLPEDAYSLLVFVPVFSSGSLCAFINMFIMYFGYSMIILDQIFAGKRSEQNLLGILPFKTAESRAISFFALTVAIAFQKSFLNSLYLIFRGYDRERYEEHFKEQEGGGSDSRLVVKRMKLRWILSVSARLCEGLLGLVVFFLLIIRSQSGAQALYSFGAAVFLGNNIDVKIFQLLKWGYFGKSVKEAADHPLIGDDVDFGEVAKSHRFNLRMLRSLCLLLPWLVYVVCWGYITAQELSGHYLPSSIYVMMGDDEIATLDLFSGLYDAEISFSEVKYVARDSFLERPGDIVKRFRYCFDDKAWIFEATNSTASSYRFQPCEEWLLKSSETNVLDPLAVSRSSWEVNPKYMSNSYSFYSPDYLGDNSRVGTAKVDSLTMVERPRECPPNTYGPKCEFLRFCDQLSTDGEVFNIVNKSLTVWGLEADQDLEPKTIFIEMDFIHQSSNVDYDLLINDEGEIVQMYDYPVYYSRMDFSDVTEINTLYIGNPDSYSVYSILVVVGRRWARLLLGVQLKEDEPQLTEFVKSIERSFKRVKTREIAYRFVTHLSEPIDLNTLEDVGMPVGFQFYEIYQTAFEPDIAEPSPGKLICTCPICSISDEFLDKQILNIHPTSPLWGKKLTCGDLMTKSRHYIKGSMKCEAIQMESISNCGCPYTIPERQACTLCSDGSPVEEAFIDVMPYEEITYNQSSCGDVSVGMFFQDNLGTRFNADYCPAIEMTFGSECGCSNTPLPSCNIACSIDEDEQLYIFDTKKTVSEFDPNTAWNGWHCGVIRGIMSALMWEYCRPEYVAALAEQCCVNPSQTQVAVEQNESIDEFFGSGKATDTEGG